MQLNAEAHPRFFSPKQIVVGWGGGFGGVLVVREEENLLWHLKGKT